MTNQACILNMIPSGVLPRVYASRFDNHTEALTFTLYNGAVPFMIPAGAAVLINGTKPDGTGFSYSAASWSGNTAVCNVTRQMTAVEGDVICELRIRTETEIIGSINFILRVEPSALADDGIISESEIPLIEQAVEIAANLQEFIQETKDAAETASDAADAATAAAARSEVINTNVEGIYGQLTSATAAANAAAESANDAADAIGNISARANTLAAGSSATASYNQNTGVMTFGIPRGPAGESGIMVSAIGMFTMSVDSDGNLYVYSSNESDIGSAFSYDSQTGNLYYEYN